jgi:hypothetical protein
MADGPVGRTWQRVSGWFGQNAEQLTVEFFPDSGQEPLAAYGGYIRLWLAEGFLARRRSWGEDHFPVLHGGLALRFLGSESTPFTTFARPPADWETPGVRLDFPVTTLLPWGGGTVEAEAALYRATVSGPLATAVELVTSLSTLLGPPLSVAAAVADKVSDGLDGVLAATGEAPVLAVHWAMAGAGGGVSPVRSGHLAVVGAPRDGLKGALSVRDGRLRVDPGDGPVPLSGVDFLVLRVECRTERDDWRFPELDELIRRAGTAYLEGHADEYQARRTDAVARAWNSTDLIPTDRRRVAKLVAEEIDAVTQLGAVPGPERVLSEVAPQRLVAPDAPELAHLRLQDLVG